MKSNLSRTLTACVLLLGALLIVMLLAAVIGSQRLPLKASVCALIGVDCGLSSEQTAILFDIRLPRILLAGLVGTCLATAGAGYQALLRNPLAEPYLLGVSNGAAVGTMTALVFFGGMNGAAPCSRSPGP
jgi:iron complex transport system permease protein